MDNKKMLMGMAVVFALILGYTTFLEKVVFPKHPDWAAQIAHKPATQPDVAPQPAPNPSMGSTTAPSVVPSTQANSGNPSMGATTVPSGQLHVAAAGPDLPGIVIGSTKLKDPTYPLALNLSPMGAGLDSVILNGYGAADDSKLVYTFQRPYDGKNDTRVLATQLIVVNGQSMNVGDVNWALESYANDRATYGIYIDNSAGAHVLHLTRTYVLDTSKSPDGGYELAVAYHAQNLGTEARTLRLDFNGPTEPPKEVERGADRQVISGYDKGNELVDVQRHGIEEYKPGADTKDIYKGDHPDKAYKFLWAGESSAYFAAIVLPEHAEQIDKVEAKALNPDSPAEDRLVTLNFETTELKIDRGASADVGFRVFFGPKTRPMLESTYYSDYPRFYGEVLSTSSSMCGFMTFPKLIDGLVGLLRIFHVFLFDWGLSIILLVILVRLCLHPITKASQVSMLKMQKMGPELERLKKKYGDDKDGYAKAQMQLYKEVGFTPILGCLPMFLQMPIWIALYSALQGEIALRQAPFLWGFTWIHDLARPDRLWAFDAHAFTLPLLGMKIASLNILPLLLAVVFFMQQKYTPKPPAATPEQAQQQKMMQWMSLLFPVFLYTAPSGLNLYILTSTGIGIIESKRIRDHIKQKQEAEKSDKVIVDAKPTRAGKQNKKDELSKKAQADAAKSEKAKGIRGWWANLQEKAEEIRRQAEKANKKL